MRILFFTIAAIFLVFGSCKKEVSMGIDMELYAFAQGTMGFTWYKKSNVLLDKSSGSGHNFAKLRTRFNDIASQNLDVDGKVNLGSKFQEESVIVKELTNASGELQRYAILYKNSNHEFADSNGWVWGYIEEDGEVAETAENKGKSCIGCHQQSGNVDYVLMNKYFP